MTSHMCYSFKKTTNLFCLHSMTSLRKCFYLIDSCSRPITETIIVPWPLEEKADRAPDKNIGRVMQTCNHKTLVMRCTIKMQPKPMFWLLYLRLLED